MNNEIKLKDMTDFLENIYKDIKKQPTLEEELEKERKFINKIKGNSKDEVKELLEHIEILDNTDYILHSDKAKALLDYITNLQEENEDLREENKEAHDFDETMKDIKENLIARINRQECEIHNLQAIIDKAIEYIKQHIEIDSNGILTITHTFDKCNMKELFNILEGSDKE